MRKVRQGFWGTPAGLASMGLIAIASYFLFIEHRQHVFDALPYLLLGACLLLHVFMHGGHGHHSHQDNADSESPSSDYQRGLEDGKKQARIMKGGETDDAD